MGPCYSWDVENLFGSDALAAGYARSRPPVHPRVVELARPYLPARIGTALDIGCGAGLSTRPLTAVAGCAIGMEPAVPMLKFAANVAPGAAFLAGTSESLPVRDGSIDLIAAAGSLNYCDPARFFAEAGRVLAPGGAVLIYDFSCGRSMRGTEALDRWFDQFERRYPWPPDNALKITRESLEALAAGFRLTRYEPFEIGLPITPEFYIDYVLTETNVGWAIRNGEPIETVRNWCSEGTGPIFGGETREVLFRGYFALLAQ